MLTRANLFTALASLAAVYHLVAVAQLPTWFGIFVPHQAHKGISVGFALAFIFWLMPAGKGHGGSPPGGRDVARHIPWYDWALMASALISVGYVVVFHENVLDYGFYGFLDVKGMVLAMMLAVPLMEAVRRATGWALPVIILFFVAVAIFQKYLPGVLYGRGYPPERLLYSAFVGDAGIFGLPLGIAANIVIVFLVFGSLMEHAGASRWFMDLALALTGWSRGGPAKAAVVASAMFGSISGSPSGNSATTGVFTIPMMKQVGYTPAFAAAVEAVASTGGMILPPVMGAIAFLMAEWIEVSYAEIAISAAIPAVLYFLIVFVSVHLQAKKDNIRALTHAELPALWPTLRRGWFYLIPMVAMVYFLLVKAFLPGMAAIYTCGFVVACSFLSRNRAEWLLPRKIVMAFRDAVSRWLVIAAITGAVGIMIGALELSGVGLKVSRFIIEVGGGNLIATLVLVGLVSLIVGMGLDATPAYITLATLLAPALVQLGVPIMSAHLFVIYWGLASFFTPPTCIAIFITAPIAGSRIWPSGWEAMKLGIAAFIVPVAFVLSPGLLLQAGSLESARAIATAFAGAVLIAIAVRGFALFPLGPVARGVLLGGGLLLIGPGTWYPLAGLGLAGAALTPQVLRLRDRSGMRPSAAHPPAGLK